MTPIRNTVVALPEDHWGWQLRRAGAAWRATGPGFVDAITSPAGFGTTPEEAVRSLARQRAYVPDTAMFRVLPPVLWASLDGEFVVEKPSER